MYVLTKKQLETAKEEVKKEFPQEEELQAKIKGLAEVDALLNMEKKTMRVLYSVSLMKRKFLKRELLVWRDKKFIHHIEIFKILC